MTASTAIQPNRVDGAGRLTPANPVRFSFDGETYHGLAGDTLASALLANDIHLVGRSFKYHRPRGILTAGPEEPNALVGIARGAARRQPNVRATVQEIHDGLDATSQNRWPSLTADVGEVNDWMSPVFAAGFYYKTFMWPKKAWDTVYEPIIRRAAGLGVAHVHAPVDVLDLVERQQVVRLRRAQRRLHLDDFILAAVEFRGVFALGADAFFQPLGIGQLAFAVAAQKLVARHARV